MSAAFDSLQARVNDLERLACDTYDDARRILLNRDGPVTQTEAQAVRNAEMRLARCLDAAAQARRLLAGKTAIASDDETAARIAALGWEARTMNDDSSPPAATSMGAASFMDGSRVTPGTAKCMCDSPEPRPDGRERRCEMPCWQRIGMASTPCCPDCAPLPDAAAFTTGEENKR